MRMIEENECTSTVLGGGVICIASFTLFGWRIQPESASHNSIFLSHEISQLFSQTVFSSHAKSASQPASQPAEQGISYG